MIVEVVPDIAWYDNFHDAPLGQNIPEGWTKYGPGPTPTVTAQPAPGPLVKPDSSSMGGRFLRFPSESAPVALGMDVAGSPDNFEILMRLRSHSDAQSGAVQSLFGGPGGRIGLNGANLIGIALAGGNWHSRTYCHWRCTLDVTHHLYEPPVSVNYNQPFLLKTTPDGNSDWAQYGYRPSGTFRSGRTTLQIGADRYRELVASGTIEWWPAGLGMVGEPGPVVMWNWMKMRVQTRSETGTQIQRIRGKWWKHKSPEPNSWLLDVDRVINLHWPQNPGPVGIIHLGETSAGAEYTEIDYVAVSLDPENVPAPEVVVPEVQSCPTGGRVGEPYEFQLQATGVNI
jgi:hypothetical protein